MIASTLTAGALGVDKAHRHVILAASLGTVFEWYDFFLYGSLAAVISKHFFAGVNETTAFIFALLTFAPDSRSGPSGRSCSAASATSSAASGPS
jgi:hypothetical protein